MQAYKYTQLHWADPPWSLDFKELQDTNNYTQDSLSPPTFAGN